MPEYDTTSTAIVNRGQEVPVVAFYSVQGGVGKTTLARKFAELVTLAPGREGRRPNVLLIDLDVEAMGLTFRMTKGIRQTVRTVHDVFAERNVAAAQALNVTNAVSLGGGNLQQRGELFLMPAAPPEATGLFDVLATIDRQELARLMLDMIRNLVLQHDISCVVIDCAPGANPYSAAAATLADFPLLIGRNERATYEQIRLLPERFREMYPSFHQAKQRVIINAVAVRELFDARAQQYAVFDYIPLIADVIHETEGLPAAESLRMLLFEKYIVDIVKQIFVGKNHLIPESPEIVGQEWIDALQRLERCEEAPKMRRLKPFRHFRWIGGALLLIGIALAVLPRFFKLLPSWLPNTGIAMIIGGLVLAIIGFWVQSERNRILAAARELVLAGPDAILRSLEAGMAHRRTLNEMRKLAETIPKPLPARGGAGVVRMQE